MYAEFAVAEPLRGSSFALNAPIFHAKWDEKSKFSNVFNSSKKKRLQEMKEIEVEEWITKQWK